MMLARSVRRLVPPLVCLAALSSCKRSGDGGGQAGQAATTQPSQAASSAAPPPSSASSAHPSSSAAPSAPSAPPVGGVTEWASIDDVKDCSAKSRDLDPNLAHGVIGLAARGKDFGTSWLYRTNAKSEGLIAFGGYDTQTRTVGAAHGLGKGSLYTSRVFPRKDGWIVTWFDGEGLAWAKTTWAAAKADVEHLRAITVEMGEHTAISATVEGDLLATAPLAGEDSQLGLFLFAPPGGGGGVKAIGATHHAKRPHHPAVSEMGKGYVVAWEDEPEAGKPRQVVISRFDENGKELDPQLVVSTPGRAASRPAVASIDNTVIAAWVEQDGQGSVVVARAIGAAWSLSGPAHLIDKGTAPQLAPAEGGMALAFVRQGGETLHIAAVHIDAQGETPKKGVIVSDATKAKGAVADAPAIASGDDGRLGVAFVVADGMKGQLRTFKAKGCLLPPGHRTAPGPHPDRPPPLTARSRRCSPRPPRRG